VEILERLKPVIKIMRAHAVVIVVIAAAAGERDAREVVGDLRRFGNVGREQLEAVRVEVIGVAAAIFAAVGAVGTHEMPGEAGCRGKEFEQAGVAGFLPEFREKIYGAGLVSGVRAFVFIEPAFSGWNHSRQISTRFQAPRRKRSPR
jgi:hypothetical protein